MGRRQERTEEWERDRGRNGPVGDGEEAGMIGR